MHDPLTVAFEIRRPWPKITKRGEDLRGKRFSLPFVRTLGREFYFPSLVTVWHCDPEVGGDDDSCRRRARKRWGFKRSFLVYKLHVHHWRIQVVPWQRLRRWLFVRCDGCGQRFRWSYSPIGYSWGGGGPVFHFPEHSPFADGRPCALVYEHENYLRWREAYPNLVGGQFDRGDPVDRWLDDKSMREELARG